MKTLVKILNWIEWISAGIGVLFLLLVPISYFFNGGNAIIGLHLVNYFCAANSFFLLTIVLFLFIHLGQYKKE